LRRREEELAAAEERLKERERELEERDKKCESVILSTASQADSLVKLRVASKEEELAKWERDLTDRDERAARGGGGVLKFTLQCVKRRLNCASGRRLRSHRARRR
jgi:hypothetical protein